MMRRQTQQQGFTIVELLIVIVVIAILAAITIAAYNGITQKANDSAAKNSIAQAQKKLQTWYIQNGESFPAEADFSSLGLRNSDTITYQYSVNNSTNPKGYCVTVNTKGVSYRIANQFTYTGSTTTILNEQSATSGACPGHTSNASVPIAVNLAQNPSAEVSASGFLNPNGTIVEQSNVRAQNGAYSVLGTMPAGQSGSNVGVGIYRATSHAAGGLKPSTTYTISAWVYAPTGVVGQEISVQGSGRMPATNPPERVTSLKNQWVRLWNTFTTTATDGQVTIYVLNRETTPASPAQQVWVDSIMLVEGTEAYNYADGNSPGWVWNGANGLSSSTGPRL